MQPTYTLITGASRGIGAALAQGFAARGRPLILAARSLPDLEAKAEKLRARHQVPIVCVACDLSTQEGVDALLAACAPYALAGVVNNAGSGLGQAFADQDPAALASMLFLNTQATTQLARHFVPQLIAHKGLLINVASQAAFQPMPLFAAYAASKAYVLHLTLALHHELRPKGVRVLALCPGATDTAFFKNAGINTEDTYMRPGSVTAVVDAAFHALGRGDAFVVPGVGNKAAIWVQRLLSRRLVVALCARLMQRRHDRAQPQHPG